MGNQDKEERPIAVIGSGIVGSIASAYLAKIREDIILVENNATRAAQIAQNGLKITGKAEISSRPSFVLQKIEDLSRYKISAVLICTKAWSLRTLLPALVKTLNRETIVVSFQNGIGTEDEIANYFESDRVARVVINFAGGVSTDNSSVAMHWFHAPNFIGPLDEHTKEALQPLVDTFNHAGMTTQIVSSHEIKKRVFFKTILNSALNALCSAAGITMKQAMTYPHTRHLAKILIREGLSVASSVGYSYGENAMDLCLNYLDKGGDHLPSMWGDIQRKSPTEIEYINGKIVKLGTMFRHINVDANLFFTSLIITEEIKAGIRQPTDIPPYLL
jgi:2-dehydropantoate 2-reductase